MRIEEVALRKEAKQKGSMNRRETGTKNESINVGAMERMPLPAVRQTGRIYVGQVLACLTLAASLLVLAGATVAFGNAIDTYTRADSTSLGTTEEGDISYREQSTFGGDTPNRGVCARIDNQMLRIEGVNTSGSSSLATSGEVVLDQDLAANVIMSAVVRYDLPQGSYGTDSLASGCGFTMRKQSASGGFSNTDGIGQVFFYLGPGGLILFRQQIAAGSWMTLLYDNLFMDGNQTTSNGGPGTLPTTINGASFDADGDGVLEVDEPFSLSAVLSGTRVDIPIQPLRHSLLTAITQTGAISF